MVAARGMVVNSAFFVGLGTLQLLKAVIVAHYLTASEFGIWAILFLAFGLVFSLKNIMVGHKYVQQDEADQEDAFLKAFTLELASSAIALVLMLAIAPILRARSTASAICSRRGSRSRSSCRALPCRRRSGCITGGWRSCASA